MFQNSIQQILVSSGSDTLFNSLQAVLSFETRKYTSKPN